MANLREIRSHIKSVGETKKITNAMYLISSSKLKKAKKSLEQNVPYFERLQKTIKSIVSHAPAINHPYFDTRPKKEQKQRAYIVISGDKGLCGAYNHNIIRFAQEHIKKDASNRVVLVGSKGKKYFADKNIQFDSEFMYVIQNPTVRSAENIADYILELFNNGDIDEAYVIYTKMITSAKTEPDIIKLLPLEKEQFKGEQGQQAIFTFSPSPEAVLDSIVPMFLKGLIFGALIEAYASEQSARMLAMDAATDNAQNMLQALTLQYNRARQAAITQQISEIVSGGLVGN